MADGATDLNDLLGSGPVQNPSLPQSTTFSPIVTGGVDPFISPQGQQNKPAMALTNNTHTFNTVRYAVKNLMVYFGFFAAAMIISLSTPRSLILQYIPNTYTSGGVVSYTGAAVLGASALIITFVLNAVFNTIF
jgi:hypothetical protein